MNERLMHHKTSKWEGSLWCVHKSFHARLETVCLERWKFLCEQMRGPEEAPVGSGNFDKKFSVLRFLGREWNPISTKTYFRLSCIFDMKMRRCCCLSQWQNHLMTMSFFWSDEKLFFTVAHFRQFTVKYECQKVATEIEKSEKNDKFRILTNLNLSEKV